MNLPKMSVRKLQSLLVGAEAELQRRIELERNRGKAENELKALAAKYGMSLPELTAVKPRAGTGKRAKATPKYRNPNDPSQTCSGRGRTPKWALEADRKPGGRLLSR